MTVKCELLYGPDQVITEMHQAWTFDDVFSALAAVGMEAKHAGEFSRVELAPLAEVNVNSLNQHSYFTHVKVNGTRSHELFGEPVNYWLEYDAKEVALTLHFTRLFKKPVPAKSMDIEVYDPDSFIEFSFAVEDPIKLIGTPSRCEVAVVGLDGKDFRQSLSFNQYHARMRVRFANRVLLECP